MQWVGEGLKRIVCWWRSEHVTKSESKNSKGFRPQGKCQTIWKHAIDCPKNPTPAPIETHRAGSEKNESDCTDIPGGSQPQTANQPLRSVAQSSAPTVDLSASSFWPSKPRKLEKQEQKQRKVMSNISSQNYPKLGYHFLTTYLISEIFSVQQVNQAARKSWGCEV
jgi:hypothetical protein